MYSISWYIARESHAPTLFNIFILIGRQGYKLGQITMLKQQREILTALRLDGVIF